MHWSFLRQDSWPPFRPIQSGSLLGESLVMFSGPTKYYFEYVDKEE
jgi:hypothetical protein